MTSSSPLYVFPLSFLDLQSVSPVSWCFMACYCCKGIWDSSLHSSQPSHAHTVHSLAFLTSLYSSSFLSLPVPLPLLTSSLSIWCVLTSVLFQFSASCLGSAGMWGILRLAASKNASTSKAVEQLCRCLWALWFGYTASNQFSAQCLGESIIYDAQSPNSKHSG